MKVLYLDLDTLRADHLGCYGYGYPTSPNIDRLANEGTLFETLIAPCVPTQPAHTTIFTGQHGVTHGIVAHGSRLPEAEIPLTTPWLPALLRSANILTAAIDNLYDHKAYFGRGWSEYYNPTDKSSGQLVTADQNNAYLLPWLREHTRGDWFMFVHYWDPHQPYTPPTEYMELHYSGDKNDPSNKNLDPWRREIWYPFHKRWSINLLPEFTDRDYLRGLYDGEITYLDDRLGQVFDALEELGIADETLVIVAADHGEVMYDHPGWFQHCGLYDAVTHVPLIIRGPEVVRGQRVAGMRQHTDLAPTILSLFGLPTPPEMVGKSLIPALRGQTLPGYDAVYLTEATGQIKWGVRTDEWKLIKNIDAGITEVNEDELYDLVRDPREQHNIADRRPDVKDRLELQLRRWWEEHLGTRTDMLRAQAKAGLPAKDWLSLLLQSQDLSYDEWVRKQRYV